MKPLGTPSQKTSLAARLARPELLTLEPYQSARRIGGSGEIWVNANELPFNHSNISRLNRYPDCQPPELIAAYACFAGVKSNQVLCGRGADEAIELLIRTFCNPGRDAIGIFTPTYGMYAISAATFNVEVRSLAQTEQYEMPTELDLFDGAKLIFVCNPNNPTSTLWPLENIRQLARQFPASLIVVDEAYIEFADAPSATTLLAEYANVAVLRTLSKAFGLAGARCGFLLANEDVIHLVLRVIAPYPVPTPVSELARQALSPAGVRQMHLDVSRLKQQGQRLVDALIAAGATVAPSRGNFVLAYFSDAETVEAKMLAAGIVTRRYRDARLSNAIRLSFSDSADTDTIIWVLKSLN